MTEKEVRVYVNLSRRDTEALDELARQSRLSRSSAAAMLIGEGLDRRKQEFQADYDMTEPSP